MIFEKTIHFGLFVFLTGAVPVDSKAAELKFWTKNDGQVSEYSGDRVF